MHSKQLDRTLGLGSVFAISTGAMLGSGIFVLPGLAAGIAGPYVALSYLLAGLLVLPAVLSKAELATAMPVAGGTYVYVDRAMGPWLGTITGLGTWVSLSAKTSFALVGLGAYLSLFADPSLIKPFSVFVLGCLTAVNLIGVGKASALQSVIVWTCLIALVLFAGVGMTTTKPEHFEPAFPQGATGIFSGAAFVFVAFAGVTKICSIAEEVRDPSRNIPLGMLLAHFTVSALYAVISLVMTGNVDMETLRDTHTPVADAANAVGGQDAMMILAVVSILGLISMSNAGLLAASRDPFAMSRRGLMPGPLSHLSTRFGTPTYAILLTALILLGFILFLPVITLAKLASGFKIFIFSVVNLSLIFLRESHARWYKPTFHSPLYPWVQIAGILGGVWLLSSLGFFPLLGVVAAVIFGSLWYLVYVEPRVSRKSAISHLWGEARTLRATLRMEADEEQTFKVARVVVPVFEKEKKPRRLIELASQFVDGGWLEVLRLEELPEQTMLMVAAEEDAEMARMAEMAKAVGSERQVRVTFKDVLTHNAKMALHDHAERTQAEWLVLPWPQEGRLRRLIRNPMAWWLNHSPCDLALYLDRGEATHERILVLAKPGPFDSLVIHMADHLARKQNGSLCLLRTLPIQATGDRLAEQQAYLEQLSRLCITPCETKVLRTDHWLASVAEISSQFDLMIFGAPPEDSLRSLFGGHAEQALADAAWCSVLELRSPRSSVHRHFTSPPTTGPSVLTLEPLIASAAVGRKLAVISKEQALEEISSSLAAAAGKRSPDAEEIVAKLQQREQQQSTARPGGFSLHGTTKSGLVTTTLGLFSFEHPILWNDATGEKVDLCLVVLSPPGERQQQLWVLGRIARLVLSTDLLALLRDASNEAELCEALRKTDRILDALLGGAGSIDPEEQPEAATD